MIREYLLSSGCTWPKVTLVLVILAELSVEVDDVLTCIDLLAESMHTLGGMVRVYNSTYL